MIKDLLPLGSIVRLYGDDDYKLLIINRVVKAELRGEQGYFEYSGCLHVIGAVNEEFLYFNQEDIAEVFFEGYKDEDEKNFQIYYREFLEKNTLKKLKLG